MDIKWIYRYKYIRIFNGYKILDEYGYGLDIEFNFWTRWIMDWIWNRIAIHLAPLPVKKSIKNKQHTIIEYLNQGRSKP